jgi:hypothetical protein
MRRPPPTIGSGRLSPRRRCGQAPAWLAWARALRARLGGRRDGWRPAVMVMRLGIQGGATPDTTLLVRSVISRWTLVVRPRLAISSRTIVQASRADAATAPMRFATAPAAKPPRHGSAAAAAVRLPSPIVVSRQSVRSAAARTAVAAPRGSHTTGAQEYAASIGRHRPSRFASAPGLRLARPPVKTGPAVRPAVGTWTTARGLRRFRRVEDPALARSVRPVTTRSAPVTARLPGPTLPVNPPAPTRPSAWDQPAPGPAMAPVNVDMLAAQVVRQIDRRITAWRERTGRA